MSCLKTKKKYLSKPIQQTVAKLQSFWYSTTKPQKHVYITPAVLGVPNAKHREKIRRDPSLAKMVA